MSNQKYLFLSFKIDDGLQDCLSQNMYPLTMGVLSGDVKRPPSIILDALDETPDVDGVKIEYLDGWVDFDPKKDTPVSLLTKLHVVLVKTEYMSMDNGSPELGSMAQLNDLAEALFEYSEVLVKLLDAFNVNMVENDHADFTVFQNTIMKSHKDADIVMIMDVDGYTDAFKASPVLKEVLELDRFKPFLDLHTGLMKVRKYARPLSKLTSKDLPVPLPETSKTIDILLDGLFRDSIRVEYKHLSKSDQQLLSIYYPNMSSDITTICKEKVSNVKAAALYERGDRNFRHSQTLQVLNMFVAVAVNKYGF